MYELVDVICLVCMLMNFLFVPSIPFSGVCPLLFLQTDVSWGSHTDTYYCVPIRASSTILDIKRTSDFDECAPARSLTVTGVFCRNITLHVET